MPGKQFLSPSTRIYVPVMLLLVLITAGLRCEGQSIAPGMGRNGTSAPSGQGKAAPAVAKVAAALPAPPAGPDAYAAAVLAACGPAPAAVNSVYAACTKNIPVVPVATAHLKLAPLGDFSIAANQTSSSQTLTLTNMGTSSYEITGYAFTGLGYSDFSLTKKCSPAILRPSGSCSLEITYTPTASGRVQPELEITANDSASVGAPVAITFRLTGSAQLTATACSVQTNHFWFPLSHTSDEQYSDIVNCWFNSNSILSLGQRVEYLYNPALNANTVSGDLASLNFPGGVQLSLVGNASSTSCSSTTSGTGSSAAASTCGTGSSGGTTGTGGTATSSGPSSQQAAQALLKGGDLGLRAIYPLTQYRGHDLQFLGMASPRAAFTVNSLSSQGTPTGGTNANYWLPAETYVQFDAIPSTNGGDSPGSLFVDYRPGWLLVPGSYAQAAGLTHHDFLFQQLAFGVIFNGLVRISAQKYWGSGQLLKTTTSSGTASTSTNNLNNWQLVVQFTPSKTAKQ